MLPSAHSILWFMAAFLGSWAVSLVVRGARGDRRWGARCPACRAAISQGLRCGVCGFEAQRVRELRGARRDWRLVGAGCAAFALAAGAAIAGELVRAWATNSDAFEVGLGAWDGAALGVAAFGVVTGAWAIRGNRSRGRRRCPRCWYDMTGASLRCPECGFDAPRTAALYRTRRSRKGIVAACAVVLVGMLVHEVPRYRRGGLPALVPATVTIALLPWMPHEVVLGGASTNEDWSLRGRYENRWLAEWQVRWLKQRADRLAETTDSVAAMRRILLLVRCWNGALSAHAMSVIAHGLASASNDTRSKAVEMTTVPFWRPLQKADPEPLIADVLPTLERNITDRDVGWAKIEASVVVIGQCREARERVAPQLVATLRACPPTFTPGLTLILGWIGRESPAVREELVRAASEPSGDARFGIAASTATESLPAPAFEQMAKRVAGASDADAYAAAGALLKDQASAERVVPLLVAQFRSSRLNRADFLALAQAYPSVLARSLPDVLGAADDPDPAIRQAVLSAVWNLVASGDVDADSPAMQTRVSELLHDENADVRQLAGTIVQWAAPAGPPPQPQPTIRRKRVPPK